MTRSRLVLLTALALIIGLPSVVVAITPAENDANFSVVRLVVGTGVEKREPVGAAETFPAGTERVLAFLEVRDIAADTDVTFVWLFGGKEVHRFSMPLRKGPFWRTWSECLLHGRAGEWKVELQGADGKAAATAIFTVK